MGICVPGSCYKVTCTTTNRCFALKYQELKSKGPNWVFLILSSCPTPPHKGLSPGHVNIAFVVLQMRKLNGYIYYFTVVPLRGISVNHEDNSLLLPESKFTCTQHSNSMWELLCVSLQLHSACKHRSTLESLSDFVQHTCSLDLRLLSVGKEYSRNCFRGFLWWWNELIHLLVFLRCHKEMS